MTILHTDYTQDWILWLPQLSLTNLHPCMCLDFCAPLYLSKKKNSN